MKDYEVVGYVADGEVVCPAHAGDVHDDTHDPIFAGSEWDEYPVCLYCPLGEGTIDTVSLAPVDSIEQTEVRTWFERDRAHIDLVDKRTDETLMEWWDEDVAEAVEDGFLKPQDWHRSAWNTFKPSTRFGK